VDLDNMEYCFNKKHSIKTKKIKDYKSWMNWMSSFKETKMLLYSILADMGRIMDNF